MADQRVVEEWNAVHLLQDWHIAIGDVAQHANTALAILGRAPQVAHVAILQKLPLPVAPLAKEEFRFLSFDRQEALSPDECGS